MNKIRVARAARKARLSARNPVTTFVGALCTIWVIVPPLRCFFFVLKLLGCLRIQGYSPSKFRPQKGKGLLVIHRHPSMRETIIIPLLVSSASSLECMLDFSKAPLVTPDRHNYFDPWWCWPIRALAIPVARGNTVGEGEAGLYIKSALQEGRTVILAPEGGRTWKGTEFKTIDAHGDIVTLQRPKQGVDLQKPIIRRFQGGIKNFVGEDVSVVPIWVTSKGWRTEIKVGDRLNFAASFPERDIPEALESLMLRLAEK